MQQIFSVTLAGLQGDRARLDSIAINLSNAGTVGYKRDTFALRSFADVIAPPGDTVPAAGNAAAMVATDWRPGSLKSTGQHLDLALAGEGLFEIATPAGPVFTRQGNFQIDARGRLVNAQGHAVAGKAGDIVLASDAVRIDASGNVFDAASGPEEGALPVAQLRVVMAEAPEAVRRLGDGLFAIDGGATEMADGAVQVRQGYLENSNVAALDEMLQLMQTLRHAESLQKITQAYDEMLGTALRKLGES